MKLSLLTLLTFFTFSIFGQTVVSSNGESYTNTAGSIDYTIGEISTESISDASNALTQGQHQPKLSINTIPTVQASFEVSLFPNPVSDQSTLTVSKISVGLKYDVFDIGGKVLISAQITATETTVDFSKLSSGQYFLKLTDQKNGLFNSFQIQKLN
jgi:hypothetical protein